MKESLQHLPGKKQNELGRIVPIICGMCDDVEMIILFGSYARGDYREDSDLPPDRKSGAPSDYDILEFGMEKERYKSASFQLHQAAESAYKALLLVYTNYSSYDHYLDSMNRQALEIIPKMEDIFPCETKADKELFKLFDYAYIGARYDPEFKISEKELVYLSGRVSLLLGLAEKFCNEKIESLRNESLP